MDLALAPRPDLDDLRAIYARDGIVRIDNLFPEPVAEAIHRVLKEATRWHVVHSDPNGKHVVTDPADWQAQPAATRNATLAEVMQRARDGFAYLYSVYPMISRYLDGTDPNWPLHAMTEYLNSPDMHAMVKYITDEPEVRKLDCQATLYARGNFLNEHDDRGDDAERRAAYVMGFTKGWRPDWGGQLLFLDGQRTVDGFSPSFNTMTLFKVPRQHVVTQVSSFAGAGRYSITGWLRVD